MDLELEMVLGFEKGKEHWVRVFMVLIVCSQGSLFFLCSQYIEVQPAFNMTGLKLFNNYIIVLYIFAAAILQSVEQLPLVRPIVSSDLLSCELDSFIMNPFFLSLRKGIKNTGLRNYTVLK